MINFDKGLGFIRSQVEARKSSSQTMVQVSTLKYGDSRKSEFDPESYLNKEIKRLICKARTAYRKDGIVRASVDIHAEQFRDFALEGPPELVEKVTNRLNTMGLRTNEGWKTLFRRAIKELMICGTAPIIKLRGAAQGEGIRSLYDKRPYSIAGFLLISPERLEIDPSSKEMKGYKISSVSNGKEKFSTLIPGGYKFEDPRALIKVPSVSAVLNKSLYPGMDICMLTYTKIADTDFGQGLTFPGLDDVSLLRTIEGDVATMIRKYSMPLLWHQVLQGVGSSATFDKSGILAAKRLHENAAPDGVLITGQNHNIKTLGAESQALRSEGYLDHFSKRSCVGVGATPSLIGMHEAGIGVSEVARERLLSKVRYFQSEIAYQLEFFLIWEILWEEGYDPFRNEKERVSLIFSETDEDRSIKMQTHAADLFTKGLVDHDQALKIGKIKGKPIETQIFHNKYGKKDEASKQTTSTGTKKKSKEDFNKVVKYYLPERKVDIEDTVYLLKRLYSIEEFQKEQIQQSLERLIHDEEAMLEYLFSTLEQESN